MDLVETIKIDASAMVVKEGSGTADSRRRKMQMMRMRDLNEDRGAASLRL